MNEHEEHRRRGTEETCLACMTRRARNAEAQLRGVRMKHANLLDQVATMARALREKDERLTALHWVWCSGGCHDRTAPLTEELVATAERAVRRMRTKLANRDDRARQRPPADPRPSAPREEAS